MMLHIGCGNSRIEEFVNIDCHETRTTDMVAPAWDLRGFADGSVEYIYSRHMLEHLSPADARRAVVEWRRVLKSGGIAHVVVPDLEFHARQLLGMAASDRASQSRHAMAGLYGWQNDADTDVHRWGYTRDSLARLFHARGFKATEDGIAELTDRDLEPWHINMRAEAV